MNRPELPTGALTVKLTPRQRAHLTRLCRMLDATQADVVRDALVHLLASLELHEPVHRVVPSEVTTESEAGPEK
jgi:hypothetical protein